MSRGQKHKGAVSELLAVVWLLSQGWEVFRNVSQHGPADLVVWNPTTAETKLVDVKSVTTVAYKKKLGGETVSHYVTVRNTNCPQVELLFVYDTGMISWECPLQKKKPAWNKGKKNPIIAAINRSRAR